MPTHPRLPARPGDRRLGHRLFMLGFIAAPPLVLVILFYGITLSMERGPSMVAEPVGAGAGDTGGANSLGSTLFGAGGQARTIPAEQTARGAELTVRDLTGRADAAHPVLVLTNHGLWQLGDGVEMAFEPGEGLWRLLLPAPTAVAPEPLAFRFIVLDAAGVPLREFDEHGEPVGPRRLPRVGEDQAIGDEPLRYSFTIHRFER